MVSKRIQQKRVGHSIAWGIMVLVTLSVAMGSLVAATDNVGNTDNPTVIITEYKVTPAVLLPG